MRLFVSGLRKLVRRPASWVTLGLLVGLLVLILIAVGGTASDRVNATREAAAKDLVTFPGAYNRVLQFITGLGGLFAVIYGAAIAGSEWSWGTLKSSVARGESRVRYILISYVSVAVMIGFGLLITFAAGVIAATVGAHLANVSTSGLGDTATLGGLPERLLKGWFAIVEEGALGFTIATLARSQLAGIGVGIAFYFGESFATIFLPDIVKYLPFSVANAALATTSSGTGGGVLGGGVTDVLPPDQALLLVGVWLVGALVVAALFADRAEIAG
jgi:ABC-type transport system involved in multi-copper enzyme maturation permease subunit